MRSIVGYTGFVGSNIALSAQFDRLYNSKNIESAFGTNPDLLIYSGIRAEKFLANKNPEEDFGIILNAIENIKKINPKRLVLISTIDVYKSAKDVDEDTPIDTADALPYGKNRYYFEQWVRENLNNPLVVRLPGLYGENIKKNFIYDMIHVIPSMLNTAKFSELSEKSSLVAISYINCDNGFFKLKELSEPDRIKLKNEFLSLGFSALNFTDSRGIFQFYNLKYLYQHMIIALENNINVLNLATEPILVYELFKFIKGTDFVNELSNPLFDYDFKTKHAGLFGGKNSYIFGKDFLLDDIKAFVENKSRCI